MASKSEGSSTFFRGKSGSQSPLFNVQLPPANFFGVDEEFVPELIPSSSAEEGFYLFVRPLSLGEHTVRWRAEGCIDTAQDITYHLTIVPEAGGNHDAAEGLVGGMRMPEDLRDDAWCEDSLSRSIRC